MTRFLVPRLGIMAVLGLGTLLIGVIVLRSPDTHSNLWNEHREGYARTPVGVVGEEGRTAIHPGGEGAQGRVYLTLLPWRRMMMERGDEGMGIKEPGQRLYLAAGCAKCHGQQGEGGVVGPPLAGLDPALIKAMARMGPAGMPAFTLEMLSDDQVKEIGAYLGSLKPGAGPGEKAVPTPYGAPPHGSPSPGSPSPVPTVAPEAPVPTPSAAPGAPPPEVPRGKAAFASKCAACHGQGAEGGYGPALTSLDPKYIQETVRQGKGAMPAFGPNVIPVQDLEDVLTYLRSLAPGEKRAAAGGS